MSAGKGHRMINPIGGDGGKLDCGEELQNGQRFGSWTVLRLGERIEAQPWRCRCARGAERKVDERAPFHLLAFASQSDSQ
jgi:hypothetical protein